MVNLKMKDLTTGCIFYTDQTSASELVIHRSNGLLINECSEMSILESLEESFSLTGEEYKKYPRMLIVRLLITLMLKIKSLKT